MKLTIEIDSETAMLLLLIHDAYVSAIEPKFDSDPIRVSRAIRAKDEFLNQVAMKIPSNEFDRINNEISNEKF